MLKPFGLAKFQDFPSAMEVVAPTAAMNRALRALSQRAVEELEMPPVRCPSSEEVETEIGGESACIALYCMIYNMFIYCIYYIYNSYLFIYVCIYLFMHLCIYLLMYMFVYICIYNYMLNTPIDGYFGENWPTAVRSPCRWRGECSVYC